MIPLENIYNMHQVSRDLMIAEAIAGKFPLYSFQGGLPKKIEVSVLKILPDPTTPIKKGNHRLHDFGVELGIETAQNKKIRIAKGLHIKEEDLDNYLAKKKTKELKKAQGNSGLSKRVNNLERFIGALIVANYKASEGFLSQSGNYKFQTIQNRLSEQLSNMDFDLDLVGKKLDETTIKPAIFAFLKQQKEKNTEK